MKTIAFYSYKGGVGRTLALSNIARRLADFGKKVIMLDLDLEAPGLHTKFSNFQWDRKVESGIVDYIYEYAINHKIPAKISDKIPIGTPTAIIIPRSTPSILATRTDPADGGIKANPVARPARSGIT